MAMIALQAAHAAHVDPALLKAAARLSDVLTTAARAAPTLVRDALTPELSIVLVTKTGPLHFKASFTSARAVVQLGEALKPRTRIIMAVPAFLAWVDGSLDVGAAAEANKLRLGGDPVPFELIAKALHFGSEAGANAGSGPR